MIADVFRLPFHAIYFCPFYLLGFWFLFVAPFCSLTVNIFVFKSQVMAIIADFMLVWLPAPTVSLRPPLTVSAGRLAKFFYGCPDNAFQVSACFIIFGLLSCHFVIGL